MPWPAPLRPARRTRPGWPGAIAVAAVALLPAAAPAQSILQRVLGQTGAGMVSANIAETANPSGPAPVLDGSVTLWAGPGTEPDAPAQPLQPTLRYLDTSTSVMAAVNTGRIRLEPSQPATSAATDVPGHAGVAANLAISNAQVLGHIDLRTEGVTTPDNATQATSVLGSMNDGRITIVIPGP
jgi:hypothetical protein